MSETYYLLPDGKDLKNLYKQVMKLLKNPTYWNVDTGIYEGVLKIGASGVNRSEWNWYLVGSGDDDNTGLYQFVIEVNVNNKQSFEQFNTDVHLEWQNIFY